MATLSAYITWIGRRRRACRSPRHAHRHGLRLRARRHHRGHAHPAARTKSPLAVFVATIALFLGINAFTTGIWGAPPDEALAACSPTTPTPSVRLTAAPCGATRHRHLRRHARRHGLLFLLFQKTRFGLAMRAWRATASRPASSASLPGDPRRVVGDRRRPRRARRRHGRRAQGQVTPMLMFSCSSSPRRPPRSAVSTARAVRSSPGCMIGVDREHGRRDSRRSLVGQEMKLAVALAHLRGPADQAVRPVRHGEGGAGLIKINAGRSATG